MSPARRLSTLCRALLLGAALLLTTGPSRAGEASDGVRRFPPVLASRAAPVRQALIVAPAPIPGDSSGAEAAAYRDRLRLLGFDVTVVPALPRPDLVLAFRHFAATVPPDADVAVLVLGALVPDGHSLYLLPSGADMATLARSTIPSEGVSVTDLMSRIAGRIGRDPVAIADRCSGTNDCASVLADMPAGVSALAGAASGPAGASLALRLLPLMGEEGLTFADLGTRLGAGGPTVASTPVLSRRFAFAPPGFFEGLPLACNDVDPQLGAEALRGGPPMEPLVAACEDAAGRYAFSPFFKLRLAVAEEQRAARAALTSCGQAAASAYLGTYPDGRYRNAVAASRQVCANPPAPPPMPTPAVAVSPLQQRAKAALDDYFGRHDYQQGDNFGRLVRLYPPQFSRGQATVSRTDHLRSLGAWYGGFDSVRFELGPASPDFSGCTRDDSCLVRGTVRVRTLRTGESQYGWEEDRFALRFDLAAGQVLMECGVGVPTGTAKGACD